MNTRLIGLHFGLIKQAKPLLQILAEGAGKGLGKVVGKTRPVESAIDKAMRLTKGLGESTAKATKGVGAKGTTALPTAVQAAEQVTKAPVSRFAPNTTEIERAFADMQRAGITPPNAAGMREFVGAAPVSRVAPPNAAGMREFVGAPGSRALVPYRASGLTPAPLELMPNIGSRALALPGAIPRNPGVIDVASEVVGQGAAKSRFGLGRLLTTLGIGGAAAGGYGMYKNMAQPGESTPASADGGTFISPPIVPTEERQKQVAAPMAGPVVGVPRAISQQAAPAPAPSPVTAAPVTAATEATAAKRKFNPFGLTAEQKARYRRETGTNFNPYSVADVNYFLNRFGDGATMSEAQADAAERARTRGTAAQNAARLKQLTGQV